MIDEYNIVCIVPVFNEEDTIETTISYIKKIKSINKIIVVNDGSTDKTEEVLNSIEDIDIYSYNDNMGKGFAISYAIKKIDFDLLLLLDGDLQETSRESEKLLFPVLNGDADFTIAKFPEAKTMTNKKGGFGLVKGLAKKGVNFFTGKSIDTTLSGQRVYHRKVIDNINYIPNRYGIEIAMTIQALNSNFKLEEIPVNMGHRYTERNIQGFIHRGKQFIDILKTLIYMYIKGYRR